MTDDGTARRRALVAAVLWMVLAFCIWNVRFDWGVRVCASQYLNDRVAYLQGRGARVELADAMDRGVADARHEIKYDGYRMLCRIEKRETRMISRNGHVESVDGLVAVQYVLDLGEVAFGQPLDGAAHAGFGEPAHFEQARLEDVELLLKVSNEAFHDVSVLYPKRPVT